MMTRRGLTQQQPSHKSSSNSSSSSSSPLVLTQQKHPKQPPTSTSSSSNNQSHRRADRKQQHPFSPISFVQRILSTRSLQSSCMILGVSVTLFVGLFGLLSSSSSNNNNNNNNNSQSQSLPTGLTASAYSNNSMRNIMSNTITSNTVLKESRLKAALWSFFAGDAVAMPSHWYYGGPAQINRDYGRAGITDYTAPVYNLAGSILNKSNLSGGGRSGSTVSSRRATAADGSILPPSIIGYVINHGKQDLWSPDQQIHYHATLQKGENTLEVQLARVLMRSIVQTSGVFDADNFREHYVTFMMMPGSHHDTYASTCHRMFFANKIFQGRADTDCPDNDGHNVDTIDGLVLPTITALAVAARGNSASDSDNTDNTSLDDLMQRAAQAAVATAAVTRRSNILENAAAAWGRTVVAALLAPSVSMNTKEEEVTGTHVLNMESTLRDTAVAIGMRRAPVTTGADQMTACYLDSAMPALLDSVAKYIPDTYVVNDNDKKTKTVSVWKALLSNANAGGENVHRGSCLGAVLGARAGMEGLAGTPELVAGLHDREALAQEIDEFVAAVMKE